MMADERPQKYSEHELHLLLSELQDERARSRMREAFWVSLIIHMVAIFLIATAPKWLPASSAVVVQTPAELLANKELTYLEMPTDQQTKLPHPPKTKYISDKDRVAMSRAPHLDQKTLQELRDSRIARNAEPPSLPPPPAPQPSGGAQQAAAGGNPGQPQPRSEPANQLAHLETPPIAGNAGQFPMGGTLSPGSAIDQAARAAAEAGLRGRGMAGGFGASAAAPTDARGNLDVLSDTMGVDFGPYLARVLQAVRMNWYNLIPEVARPPIMKRGRVAIEFAILKDGTVAGMRVTGPSGDVALDRAAWGGISASNPFPPLPNEFKGQYLALRFRFYYNPDTADLR
jgi:TonB family protein